MSQLVLGECRLLKCQHVVFLGEELEPLVLQLLGQLNQNVQVLDSEVHSFQTADDRVHIVGKPGDFVHLEQVVGGEKLGLPRASHHLEVRCGRNQVFLRDVLLLFQELGLVLAVVVQPAFDH